MDDHYWRLDNPPRNDYAHCFVNGGGRHRFGLPGIRCSVCNQTWGGSRILPFDCPPEFRDHPNVLKRWPIDEIAHRALREQLQAALAAAGTPAPELKPGDSFQPLEAEFPSRPRGGFLWPALGTAVVPASTRALFEQHAITGVVFCPVTLTKVGRMEPDDPFPRPSTGEPEDIMREVELEADPGRFGPLYEMVIVSESGRPPGAEITHRCPGCEREEYDNKQREFVLTPAMVPETDVFYLATTLWILANDRVRDLLLDQRLTNVELKPMAYRP